MIADTPSPTPPITMFSLVHPTDVKSYDFRPSGTMVEVTYTTKRHRDVYTVTVGEARELWSRLVARGYERF